MDVMTPLVPLGYVVARLSLAGVCAALLACPLQHAHVGASPLAQMPQSTAAHAPGIATQSTWQPGAPEAPDSQLPHGVHPLGLSSDGQPHDVLRRPVPATRTDVRHQ